MNASITEFLNVSIFLVNILEVITLSRSQLWKDLYLKIDAVV